jgi:hypothetical protein
LRCLGGCNVKRQQIWVSPRKFDQTLGQGGLHDVEESIADCNPCLLNLTRIPCSQGLKERKIIQISAQRHWWVPLILEKILTCVESETLNAQRNACGDHEHWGLTSLTMARRLSRMSSRCSTWHPKKAKSQPQSCTMSAISSSLFSSAHANLWPNMSQNFD